MLAGCSTTLSGPTPASARRAQPAAGPDRASAGIDTGSLRLWLPPAMSFKVNPSRRYLLISPCGDEAQYIRRTLDSVAAQSIQSAA
jgi:hypothetical protein